MTYSPPPPAHYDLVAWAADMDRYLDAGGAEGPLPRPDVRAYRIATKVQWTPAQSAAAAAEGWDIFDSTGSEAGPWQVQSFDDGDPVDLGDDMVAWSMVRRQATPHARAALAFLAEHNPLEHARILSPGVVVHGRWDYATDSVVWGETVEAPA